MKKLICDVCEEEIIDITHYWDIHAQLMPPYSWEDKSTCKEMYSLHICRNCLPKVFKRVSKEDEE